MLLRPPHLHDANEQDNDNLSHNYSESDARRSNKSKGKPKKKQNSLSLRNRPHEDRSKEQKTDRSYERQNDTGSVASHASGKSKKNKKKQSSLGGNKPRHVPVMNNSYSRDQSSPEPIDYRPNIHEQSQVKQLGLISSPQSKFEQPQKYAIQNFEDDEDDLPVVKLSQQYNPKGQRRQSKPYYEDRLSPKVAERKQTRRLGKLFQESRSRNLQNTSQGGSQLGGSFLNNSSAVGQSRRSRSKLGKLFKQKSREKDATDYNTSRVDFTQNNSSLHFDNSIQHQQPQPQRGMNFRDALNQIEKQTQKSKSRQKPKTGDNSMRQKVLEQSVKQFQHGDKSDLDLSQSHQMNSRFKSRAQPSQSFTNKDSLCFTIQPQKNQNKRKGGLKVTSKVTDHKEEMHRIGGNLVSKEIDGNLIKINGNLESKQMQYHQRLQNNLLQNQKYLQQSGLINNSPQDKRQQELKRKQQELKRRQQQMQREKRAIAERNARYEQQLIQEDKRRRQSIEREREQYREELEKRNKEQIQRKRRQQAEKRKLQEEEKQKQKNRKKQEREREERIEKQRKRQKQEQKELQKERMRQLERERQWEQKRQKQRQLQKQRQQERRIQMEREYELQRQREEKRRRKEEKQRKIKQQSQKASTQPEVKFQSLDKLPSSFSRVQSSVGDDKSERSVSSKKPSRKKKESAITMKKKAKVLVELSPRGQDSFYEDTKSNEEPSQAISQSKATQGPKNILSFEEEEFNSGEQKIKSKTDTMFYDPSISAKAPSSKPPLSRKSASSKSRPKQSSLTKKGERKAENVVINKKNTQRTDGSKNNQGIKKLSLVELAMQKQYEPRSESGSSYRSHDSFRSNDYQGSIQSRGSYNSRNSKKSTKKQSTVQIKAKQNSALLPNRPPSYRKLSPQNNSLANRTISHQRQMEEASYDPPRKVQQHNRKIVSKDVCYIDEKGRLVRKDIIIKGNRVESGRDSTFDENKILNRMRQSRERRRSRSRDRSMQRSRMSSTQRSSDKKRGSFYQTDSFLPHPQTDTNFVESEAYSQDSGTQDFQYQGRLTGFSSAYGGFQQKSSEYYNQSRNPNPHYHKNSNINYLKQFIKPVQQAGINNMQTPSRNNRFQQGTNQKRVMQRTERSAKKRY